MTDKIEFPVMKGSARMARGAGYFEVPLFSHVIDGLWQGCSPAEFNDKFEHLGYPEILSRHAHFPANCHWLWEEAPPPTDLDLDPPWEPLLVPRFDAILNLYVWGKYVVPDGVAYKEVEMYDSADGPDKEQIDMLGLEVALAAKVGRVLVHCQAGLNRSSLVVARALMIGWDMTADQAIAKVRESRSPVCLCNDVFEKFLRSYDDKN